MSMTCFDLFVTLVYLIGNRISKKKGHMWDIGLSSYTVPGQDGSCLFNFFRIADEGSLSVLIVEDWCFYQDAQLIHYGIFVSVVFLH